MLSVIFLTRRGIKWTINNECTQNSSIVNEAASIHTIYPQGLKGNKSLCSSALGGIPMSAEKSVQENLVVAESISLFNLIVSQYLKK